MKNSEIQKNKNGEINIALEQSESDCLYHYTGNSGLMGITSSNCFWVSRSDFLNDSQEIVYFKEILEATIKELEVSFDDIVNVRDQNGNLLKLIITETNKMLDKYSEIYMNYARQIFVLSLSENNDSLTLFSNYSNGDGYNIGLKREDFLNQLHIDYQQIIHLGQASKINYNREAQENIVFNDIYDEYESLIEILTSRVEHPTNEEINSELKKFFNLLSLKFFNYSIFFKHPTFYHEEEYRIIFLVDDKDARKVVKFRPYNSIIIPYIEIKLREYLPIKTITIGPKNNLDIAKNSVEVFLNYNPFQSKRIAESEISVIKSQIPLRY